jgi:tRNA(adenine34) deaminase
VSDEARMREALAQARVGAGYREVPIGCVITQAGRIVARAHDMRESTGDPTAHAEVLAIRQAAVVLGTWRLAGCVMYVTLEPCAMCAGAIVLARVDRVVYGADSPKSGAVRSLFQILDDPRLNHRAAITPGVLADEASSLIRDFFQGLRAE